MKKNLLTICLFLFVLCAFGQAKYELGKVTIEELKEKKHPKDTAAVAAILFKNGKTYFDVDSERNWILVTEVETRIKIYKKDGYSLANQQVGYYTGGKQVRLFFDDAVTYNLVGDKIEKTKLKSDGEFTEKVTEDYSYKKIALPNVKEGSIIEYKYTLKTPYFALMNDWYFQYPIPANHVQYKTTIPEYFFYNVFMKGYLPVNSTAPIKSRNNQLGFDEVITSYSIDDVKAIKQEPYVNNMDNYTSMIQMELASTYYPQRGSESYATDWETVAKKIYEYKDFGDELKATSYFEKDLDAVLKDIPSREDRVNAIFNYVKSRMNWNERFGYYCNVGVKKAYAEKVGNVAEINLMLVAMLRYAEIKANPVLVSTRSNGIALFPNRGAYNYVVAAIELENKEVLLLDATTKNALPDILPVRALNWTGRMIRRDKTSVEIGLMPKMKSKEVINVIASIGTDGKVTGKVREQYFDYNAYSFREHYLTMPKDKYLEQMEKRYNGIEVEDYSTANDKDLSKPMMESYSFAHSNVVEHIGNKAYFSPMLHYTQTENPFKDETREFPIDFVYPSQDKYSFAITIPEGYEIESLPTPLAIAMEENIGSFKYNISQAGRQIQVSAAIEINYANIPADFYVTLRDFYKKMLEKQNEKVVLKKV
ncbi:DUF3857 domain-containing protein [Flavobacterium sp. WW92]|uniref:DUF3857 domain-containing protein n=1 Tax=unclassified Flavobacterium TaxID=196869 RepID=UPI00222510C3|nr:MULTISPECIES: DUF3857 domain-containing protein [unclassified Flavobacterium]WDO14257.1 DUF3857 domain-containing protein [Flavobacterium sp. WW92]